MQSRFLAALPPPAAPTPPPAAPRTNWAHPRSLPHDLARCAAPASFRQSRACSGDLPREPSTAPSASARSVAQPAGWRGACRDCQPGKRWPSWIRHAHISRRLHVGRSLSAQRGAARTPTCSHQRRAEICAGPPRAPHQRSTRQHGQSTPRRIESPVPSTPESCKPSGQGSSAAPHTLSAAS